jgi:ferredoxin
VVAVLVTSLRTAGRPRPGWTPDIDTTRCTGCGWCVAACEPHLLSLEVTQWRKHSVLHDALRCTGCSDCAVACPFHVIAMRKGEKPRDPADR